MSTEDPIVIAEPASKAKQKRKRESCLETLVPHLLCWTGDEHEPVERMPKRVRFEQPRRRARNARIRYSSDEEDTDEDSSNNDERGDEPQSDADADSGADSAQEEHHKSEDDDDDDARCSAASEGDDTSADHMENFIDAEDDGELVDGEFVDEDEDSSASDASEEDDEEEETEQEQEVSSLRNFSSHTCAAYRQAQHPGQQTADMAKRTPAERRRH